MAWRVPSLLVAAMMSAVPFASPPTRSAPSPDSGAVVINEILYAPSPPSNEFVELYNRSDTPVDLRTLEYADGNRTFSPVAATKTILEPGAHVVLARDTSAFRAAFPEAEVRAPPGWAALNNSGDTVYLRRTDGTTVDAVPYEPSWGGADGRSLERIDPAAPSDVASTFAASTAPAGATPGRRNSRYAPDERPPRPVFAEMTAETRAVVTFSEPVRAASIRPAAFALSGTGVARARLATDTTATVSFRTPPSALRLRVTGVRDRVGNRRGTATLPLAYRPTSGTVILNEILYAPRTDDYDDRPDQVEYVELRGRTDRFLSLSGFFLTDRPDESGVADTLRLGQKVALAPRGYGVLAAAPDNAARPARSQLARAFPAAPLGADSVAVLLADAARLGLTNDGGLVRLHRADGRQVAEVRYRPDWHTAGLEDPTGTALERISPAADAPAADNWTSSPVPAGGTPGTRNAVGRPPPTDSTTARLQVVPSPFSVGRDGATRIRYRLDASPSLVRVRIFDARGRKVRTLEDARLVGRSGELVWNGRNDAGHRVRVGVYVVLFEAVQAGSGTVTQMKESVVVARSLD
ncbi:MAG: lamin tail domain-containing protein [Salinibacter sp.]